MIFQRHFESVTIPSTKFGRGLACVQTYPISSVARGKRTSSLFCVQQRYYKGTEHLNLVPRFSLLHISLSRSVGNGQERTLFPITPSALSPVSASGYDPPLVHHFKYVS